MSRGSSARRRAGGRGSWPSAPRRFGAPLLAALAISCGPAGDSSPPAPPPAARAAPAPPAPAASPPASDAPAAEREAGLVFATRCATCHGPLGAGDGPGSAGLEPRPRDFRDSAWQASVSDAHLRQIIVGGGPAVGRSPLMPPNPDLAGKPEVVAALVVQIRSLRSP